MDWCYKNWYKRLVAADENEDARHGVMFCVLFFGIERQEMLAAIGGTPDWSGVKSSRNLGVLSGAGIVLLKR